MINKGLIREENLEERNHPTYTEINKKIFNAWDEFNDGVLSALQLLQKCAKVYTRNTV